MAEITVRPGVLFRGALTSYSGYGTAALTLIPQLDKWMDLGLIGIEITNGTPQSVTDILQRDLIKQIHCYIEFTPTFGCNGKLRDTFSVLYTMVETDRLTSNTNEALLKSYHLIIVANKQSQKVLGDVVGIDKVKVVPLGIDTNYWKYKKRKLKKRIRFACVGYMNKRKGIDLTLKAFREVRKKYDCTLDIHTTGMPLRKELYNFDGVNLVAETYDRDELRDFYYTHDVLVCSSRGEGCNLPAMEMLSTGGTVIASKWAGHEMFMSRDYAYPVKHKMVYTNKNIKIFEGDVNFVDKDWITPGTKWAEPLLDDIVRQMENICSDRETLMDKMENTQVFRDKFNSEKIANEFWETINVFKYNSQEQKEKQ